MRRAAAMLVALATLAGCIPPQGVTKDDLAAYDAAVASIGCEMVGDSDYAPVELQTGMPREKLLEIASYKVSQEEAVALENGGVRLVTGICAPAA